MALSFEVASVVGFWCETLIYGIYTCLFIESMYIMLRKRSTSARPAKVFLVTTVVMYLVATAHIIINLYRFLRAFIYMVEPLGAAFYLSNYLRWDTAAHNATLCIMTWLGDALVIYRCFIIWNNNYYVIILPVILLMLSIVTNTIMFFWFTHPGSASVETILPWLNTIYPFAFVQNVLTTGMIALKIWRQHRSSAASGVINTASRLSLIHVMRIIVESAMIYTVQLLILIILYPLHHNAQFIVQSAVIPSIGIVFVLIAVRVHFTKSRTLFADSVAGGMPSWLDRSTSDESCLESGSRPSDLPSPQTFHVRIDEEKFRRRSILEPPTISSNNVSPEQTDNL